MFPKIIKLSILFVLLLAGYSTASASFTISRPSTNNLGLVGHWTFDGKDVVSGVALDSSGNGNNVNLFNIATSTFYSAGKIGQGFNFDGVDDAASTTSSSLSLTSAVSVSAWIYSVGTASDLKILVSGPRSGTPYYEYIFVRRNTNNLALGLSTTAGQSETASVGTIPTNQWTHVAGTWDGSNIRLYINGVMDSGSPISKTGTIVEQNNNFTIGTYNNAQFWNGKMDDVRVYNRALSSNEIKNLYNQGVSKFNKTPTNTLTSGLVGHWTFDGGKVVNGVALDSAGSNNGNLINIATSTFYSIGKIGQGFNFDGVDDYGEVASSTAFNDAISSNVLTMTAWVNFIDKAGSKIIISKPFNPTTHTSPYASYTLYISSARKVSIGVTTGGTFASVNSSAAMASSTWYHIAGVYNGSNLRVYINGAIDSASTNKTGNITVYQTPLRLSANGALGEVFNGKMDDVRVYNRALSEGEVKQLYNIGR